MNKRRELKPARGKGGAVRERHPARILRRAPRPLQERGESTYSTINISSAENETNIQTPKSRRERRPSAKRQNNKNNPDRGRRRVMEVTPIVIQRLEQATLVLPRQLELQVAPVRPMPRLSSQIPRYIDCFCFIPQITIASPEETCSSDGGAKYIKWLKEPMMPTGLCNSRTVCRLQKLIAEWDDSYENKVFQVLKWIGYAEIFAEQVSPPKKWPEDLDLAEWDNTAHGRMWETIKWLRESEMPTEQTTPRSITDMQQMMAEWDDTYENKVYQVLEWIGYEEIFTEQVTPPKVVSLKESASQGCSKWSASIYM